MPSTSTPREKEKQFILAEDWPHWPLLPVKRQVNGFLEVGIMRAPNFHLIYKANLWSLSIGNQLRDHECIEYASLDEALADGWRGD